MKGRRSRKKDERWENYLFERATYWYNTGYRMIVVASSSGWVAGGGVGKFPD